MAEPIKGVSYATPPTSIMPAISSQIDEYLKGLPSSADGTFLLDITTDRGINGVIVARRDGRVDLAGAAYIGKSWGQPVRAA
jgi:hypothetical protein